MIDDKERTTGNKSRMEAVDLDRFVLNMIEELPERTKNVITERLNINNKGTKTLDEIGREYEITRERVRQIEKEALEKLKRMGGERLNKVFDCIRKEIMEKYNGIISEEKLMENFFGDNKSFIANRQIILLILLLDDKIKTNKENSFHKKIYFYNEKDVLTFKEVAQEIENYLRAKNEGVSFGEVEDFVKKRFYEKKNFQISDKTIEVYLETSKGILKNILGKWGCAKWPYINPRNARDKAYLFLKKKNKPLHFSEIDRGINDIWPRRKKINSQTTHNELIKDSRFVLVGRGIYALGEWGYKRGTVLDVIKEAMKKNGEMNQKEIIAEVLRKRKVKENTVVLNLQNKKYFEKMSGKIYKLKRAE